MSSERLSAAAEELVKAACLDQKMASDSASWKEMVNAVNASSESTKDVKKQVCALKESVDAKLNTLNQNMNDIKVELVKLNKNTLSQKKSRALQWAIQNAELTAFDYFPGSSTFIINPVT